MYNTNMTGMRCNKQNHMIQSRAAGTNTIEDTYGGRLDVKHRTKHNQKQQRHRSQTSIRTVTRTAVPYSVQQHVLQSTHSIVPRLRIFYCHYHHFGFEFFFIIVPSSILWRQGSTAATQTVPCTMRNSDEYMN